MDGGLILVEVLVIPVILLVSNAYVRLAMGLEQSAAADLALLFVMFDAAAIMRAPEIQPLSTILPTPQWVVGYFLTALFCSLFLWWLLLYHCEVPLRIARNARGVGVLRKAGFILLGVTISMFVITLNTLPFTLKRMPPWW